MAYLGDEQPDRPRKPAGASTWLAAELLCMAGLLLISAALWLAWPPLAYIFTGLIASAAGVHLHRRNQPPRRPPARPAVQDSI